MGKMEVDSLDSSFTDMAMIASTDNQEVSDTGDVDTAKESSDETPSSNQQDPPNKRHKGQSRKNSATGNRRRGNENVQVHSVVKLFVKKVHPVFTSPWRKSWSESSSTGTGFIIDGKRIVTNSHVVHHNTTVLCRAQSGPPVKWACEVESISLVHDLAILRVTDESFFDNKPFLKLVPPGFENLPHLDDNVTAVGFPTGGDQISVTRGVVSRITHRGEILRVQIDAAINPGNSGGPVFDRDGNVVGVATAVLKNASNIGYIIPATVVHLFMEGTRETEGRCNAAAKSPSNPEGFCGVAFLGFGPIQTLENPTVRQYLGLEEEGGVRIVSVDPLGGCYDKEKGVYLIKPDDVLLSIDGILVGQDGTVQLPGRLSERISFSALVTSQLPTKPISVTILRKGERLVQTIIPSPRRYMVPRTSGYDAPDALYVICGGCVFVPLTKPWIDTKKRGDLFGTFGGPLTEENRQIVMLSTVLANSVNVGYHGLSCMVLRAFDGVEVFNLQHLATLIQKSANPMLEFRLKMNASVSTSTPKEGSQNDSIDVLEDATVPADEVLVVLDREKCKEADPIIREGHMISAACSPEIEFDW